MKKPASVARKAPVQKTRGGAKPAAGTSGTAKKEPKSQKSVKRGRKPAQAAPGAGAQRFPDEATGARRPLARAAAAAAEAGVPSSTDSGHQTAAYERAITLFHSREFTKAKVLFEAAALGPNAEMAHAAQLHVRMCEHRIARAEPDLRTPEDRYNYAVTLINRGELDGAEEQLRLALSQTETADHMHYAMALCRGLKGDMDGAFRSLKRAIELRPGNRVTARNDPDFHEMAQQHPLRGLLYS